MVDGLCQDKLSGVCMIRKRKKGTKKKNGQMLCATLAVKIVVWMMEGEREQKRYKIKEENREYLQENNWVCACVCVVCFSLWSKVLDLTNL